MTQMHDPETQQKFVELRAQGRTFVRIAAELKVCKRTLIGWSRKFQFEIHNQRAIELEALQEQYLAGVEERVRRLGARLAEVEAELAKRSVAELSTVRLFVLADALRRQIGRETGQMCFRSPVSEIPAAEYHEAAQEWDA